MATAIWNKISKGEIDPVYLLTGLEQHILDSTVSRLKKALPDLDNASVISFDLDETPVDVVIEEADTIPFLQDRKLIIARNASFLKATEKNREKVTHDLVQLEAWLKNPSPTAVVVFMAPYEKLDARKRITKAMKEHATVVIAERLQGKDLQTWIQHTAGMSSVHISSEIAEYLIKTVGDDLLTLASEIQKMATYLNAQGEITIEVIEKLVPRTPEVDVFRLTESYIKGNVVQTISIYRDLLRNGEEPIMLTSLLASHIRLMIHVGSLKKKGYPQHQIAKSLNVHPYRVKLMMENTKNPNSERLMQLLQNLAEIDYKLKSTSGKRERLLELFFLQPMTK